MARPGRPRQTEQGALATYVTTVDSQLASDRTSLTSRQSERRFAVALVSALSLFAFAVHGYHPYAEDGGLYIAGVKRLLDPALYPHATDFVLEPMRFSLFAPLIAVLVRLNHVGLPAMLLALHLATIWVTLFAAWMLASRCWTTRTARAGAVVLLACWLALPVAGTALLLMDPYLTARSFSTPCMVLALVGVLDSTEPGATKSRKRRGLALWACSLLFAAAMHPLMASYALGATLMLACIRSPRREVRLLGTPALALVSLMLAGAVQLIAKPETADYVRVALTRSYWFPAQWAWYELLGLAAPLLILALFARESASRAAIASSARATSAAPALAQMSILVGATALIAALIFCRAATATHLVARMQPLRAFQVVYLLMVLMLGAALGESILRRKLWRWCAAIILLGGVMLGVSRAAFPRSDHIELASIEPGNPWVQGFLWIRDHTPKDALFALDADYINASGEDAQCFRAIAARSALPDYSKDGGEASIAPELTPQWKIGQAAQQGLSAPATTDAQRLAALSPLGVSWVVLQTGAVTNLDCPYSNAAVRVCRLR